MSAMRRVLATAINPQRWRLTAGGTAGWPGSTTNPVAVHYNGKTYIAVADTAGNQSVMAWTHATNAMSAATVVGGPTTPDWHNTPALLVRSSDHKIVAVYCAHDGAHMYTRVSTNAEDVSAFGSQTEITSSLGGTADFTYPVLVQLSGESAKIYLFYREWTGGNTGVLSYATSTDGGATWSARTQLYSVSGKSSYWAVASNGTDRIDIATTNGTAADNASVYHFYYTGGKFYTSSGAEITAGKPYGVADLTKLYDGASAGARYTASIVGNSGNPVVAFPVAHGDGTWDFKVARYAGGSWSSQTLANNGSAASTQGWIDGGISLASATRLFLSRLVGTAREIYEYRSADGGSTWTGYPVTAASGTENAWPNVVRDAGAGLTCVWVYGTCADYLAYRLGIAGVA